MSDVIATRSATSDITVRRWVRPAGIAPRSWPSVLARYGRSTRTTRASVTTLSTLTRREPTIRARISPATGRLTKATAAAYR
nr:hypothetical protein [Planotetraspora mira]